MTKFKTVSGDFKVFYRILPSENSTWNDVKVSEDGQTVHIRSKPNVKTFKRFECDGIFQNIQQERLYEIVMENVLPSVFQGQNSIIVAFGQTGSGKSITAAGLHFLYQDRGLIPRLLEDVFSFIEKLPSNIVVETHISYIDILTMYVAHDLLKPYPSPINRYDINRYTSKVRVKNYLEALRYVFTAEGKKEFTDEKDYPSHKGTSIFTVHLTVKNMLLSEAYQTETKIHVIDLAGNDFFGDNYSIHKNSVEVGTANLIKSHMEQFMLLLKGNHIKLAKLREKSNIVSEFLGDSFSNSSFLRFIGHLKLDENNLFTTSCMLRFGHLVKNTRPKGTTRVMLEDIDLLNVEILQAKLKELVEEKMIAKMLQNEAPKDICQVDKKEQNQRLVQDFIDYNISFMDLLESVDVKTILTVMKDSIKDCELQNERFQEQISNLLAKKDSEKPSIASEMTSVKRKSKVKSTSGTPNSHSINSIEVTSKSRRDSSRHIKGSIDSKVAPKKPNKYVQGSNLALTKGAVVKRKAGAVDSNASVHHKKISSVTQASQQSAESLNFLNIILPDPDSLPEYREAVKDFITSDDTTYKPLSISLLEQEEEAKIIYQNYIKEVKELNSLMDILELRKNELLQARFMRQYSKKEERDERGSVIPTDLETKCDENLNDIKNRISYQQETILNYQAELKLALQLLQKARMALKKEFDKFCKKKYAQAAVDLNEPESRPISETLIPVEKICEPLKDEEADRENMKLEMFNEFKLLIIKEAKKKADYIKKSVKWKEPRTYTYGN